ncbi:MAG: hypothetical protein ACR2JY_01845 [Chloroflexota bacterium]
MILADQVFSLLAAVLLLALFFTLLHFSSSVTYRSRIVSEQRAETLLRDVLSAGQFHQLRRRGYLDVPSPSRPNRTYRIPRSRDQVRVYEDGRLLERLCVQAVEPVPTGDVVLIHKLMIEANEDEYLRLANHFR